MSEPSISLVMLHGWGHNAETWAHMANALGAYHPIIFDLPGFGKEPLISDTWGVPEYATWVEKKIAEKKLQRVVLLGHSFGGRIAALIASRRPEWLAGLVLYGAPVLYRPSLFIRMQNRLAKLAKHLVPRRLVPFQNPELAAANRQGLGPVFRRTVRFDQTNFLPRIAVPTLLLWGEHDRAVPVKLAQEALQLIPGSELIVLPGAGHTAHFENLGLFYGIISRFLSKHEHPFPIH